MLCRTSEFLCNSCFWCTYCNYQGEDDYGFGFTTKSGRSGAEDTLLRVELITTLRLANRPTQMKNMELLTPMATKLPNPQNCTTATEVVGGNLNWKLAIACGKTKHCWIKKIGMPGCHANETFPAVFWANSTENTNFLIKIPHSNTWSEEHFWLIFFRACVHLQVATFVRKVRCTWCLIASRLMWVINQISFVRALFGAPP